MEARQFVRNPNDTSALRVLVVDPQVETREVLSTILSRRGVEIVSATRHSQGLRLAREFRPDVVVFDSELSQGDESGAGDRDGECGECIAAESFESMSPENPPSLILLGSARRNASSGSARYVQKPYLYGPLIHTIEELLAQRRAA
jgi:CheY-like chemotaxis protein